jgi:large subunit ribosomal protein L4
MKTSLYNLENKAVGDLEVSEAVFGETWRPALVQQAIVTQLANRRRPWAHVKDRSEVRGGGKKPWRQKGTGRARHGSIRSPLWAGGGKAHGPRNDKDYSKKLNKKMRQLALRSVLSKKLKNDELRFVESLAIAAPKTKTAVAALKAFGPQASAKGGSSSRGKRWDVLFVPDRENKALGRAVANLPKTKVLDPGSLNVYDILNYKRILIDRSALPVIERHYSGNHE